MNNNSYSQSYDYMQGGLKLPQPNLYVNKEISSNKQQNFDSQPSFQPFINQTNSLGPSRIGYDPNFVPSMIYSDAPPTQQQQSPVPMTAAASGVTEDLELKDVDELQLMQAKLQLLIKQKQAAEQVKVKVVPLNEGTNIQKVEIQNQQQTVMAAQKIPDQNQINNSPPEVEAQESDGDYLPDYPVISPKMKMDMSNIDINIPIETSPIKNFSAEKPATVIQDEDDFYDPVSPVGSDNNNIHEYGEEQSFAQNNAGFTQKQQQSDFVELNDQAHPDSFQNQYSNEVEYQNQDLLEEEDEQIQNDESALHTQYYENKNDFNNDNSQMAYDLPSQEGSYAQDEEGECYDGPNNYENDHLIRDEANSQDQDGNNYSEGNIGDNEQSFHDEIRQGSRSVKNREKDQTVREYDDEQDLQSEYVEERYLDETMNQGSLDRQSDADNENNQSTGSGHGSKLRYDNHQKPKQFACSQQSAYQENDSSNYDNGQGQISANVSSHKFAESFGRTGNESKYGMSAKNSSIMGGNAMSVPSFGAKCGQFRENEMSDQIGMFTVDNGNSEINQDDCLLQQRSPESMKYDDELDIAENINHQSNEHQQEAEEDFQDFKSSAKMSDGSQYDKTEEEMVFEEGSSIFKISKIISHKYMEDKDMFIFQCEICDYNPQDNLLMEEGAPENLRIRWLKEISLLNDEIQQNRIHFKFYCKNMELPIDGISDIDDLLNQISQSQGQSQSMQGSNEKTDRHISNSSGKKHNNHSKFITSQTSSDSRKNERGGIRSSQTKLSGHKRRYQSSNDTKNEKTYEEEQHEPAHEEESQIEEQKSTYSKSKSTYSKSVIAEQPAKLEQSSEDDLPSIPQKRRKTAQVDSDQEIENPEEPNDESQNIAQSQYYRGRRSGRTTHQETQNTNTYESKSRGRKSMSSKQVKKIEKDKVFQSESDEYAVENSYENDSQFKSASQSQNPKSESEEINQSYDDEMGSNEGHEVQLGFSMIANKLEEEKASTCRYNTRSSRAANRGLNKRGIKLLEKGKNAPEQGYNTTTPQFDQPDDLYENSDEEDDKPQRRVKVKKPNWQLRNEQDYEKAQYAKKKRDENYLYNGSDDEQKERKRAQKFAKEIMKTKDIIGSFENDNKPLRIRSLRKKKVDQKKVNAPEILATEADENDDLSFTPNKYPYHLVMCTIEWYQQKTKQNEIIRIRESKVSYEEIRNKAPQLLVDYFERHSNIM